MVPSMTSLRRRSICSMTMESFSIALKKRFGLLVLVLVAMLVLVVFLIGHTIDATNIAVTTTSASNYALVFLGGAVEVKVECLASNHHTGANEHSTVTLFQPTGNFKIVSTVVLEKVVVLGFFLGLKHCCSPCSSPSRALLQSRGAYYQYPSPAKRTPPGEPHRVQHGVVQFRQRSVDQ